MNNIKLRNFQKIKNNRYLGFMSFGEYVDLIKSDSIYVPKGVDGYHPAKGIAMAYNHKKEACSIVGYQVILHIINKDGNFVEIEDSTLNITATEVTLIDGVFRSMIVTNLDERYSNEIISIIVDYSSIHDAQAILMQAENKTKNL